MKTSALRVLLVGAAGRMGKTITDLAEDNSKIDIMARCDLGDSIESAVKNCDVVIDVSHANAVREIRHAALAYHKSVVIGTTGHSEEQRRLIEETAQPLPIVVASNLCAGVTLLFWLTRKSGELLGRD